VKINAAKLRSLADKKAVSIETLASAVERTGLDTEKAQTAVRNWMRDNDHPRCKKEDINALAGALGVNPTEISMFTAVHRYHRGSPRKAKLLVDLVRGKRVDVAQDLLTFTTKRAALDVKRALKAAIADAEQAEADVTALYIAKITCNNGPHMKRFQPKDRGRAHPILKRTAHITIGLEERN